jgi:CheY-like chemotaxis protein
MIFLIDDKKQRQLGYGWNDDKFNNVKKFVMPIYNYEQILEENIRNNIFKSGNVVLFHESFFDTTYNKHEKDSITIRTELEKYAKSSEDFSVAFFSGSKNSRYREKNVINLPVGTLYANLEIFVEKYVNGETDFRFLLFGENPEIEEYLIQSLEIANQNLDLIENYESSDKNLYLKPSKDFIQKPLLEFDEKIIFKVSDKDFNEKVLEWLNGRKYDNIFIPLCIGSILSDYNGLRLAMHIRTTSTLSQFANIYIYGFVDHSFLVNNDYFDVLKTKNVQLIDYRRSSFRDAIFQKKTKMMKSELSAELVKIRMTPPKDYEDSHSISNEWSIIRWFKTLEASRIIDYTPDEIESIESKINSNLYYKYLTSRFPLDDAIAIDRNDLVLKNTGRILYIDDEIDKGWNELFCTLLYDGVINQVENYESIGSEFFGMKKTEVIETCINKAKDFDLIILDFRLLIEDFHTVNPRNITGYEILKGIKDYNKGIQVIIFSATNKVWNLQALQEAGADGFIIKEAPENSEDNKFTYESILNFITTVNLCLNRSSYLKSMYELTTSIKEYFYNNRELEFDVESKEMVYHFSKFQLDVINQLDIAFLLIYRTNLSVGQKNTNQSLINHAFTSLYIIFEYLFKNDIQGKINLKTYDNSLKRFIPYDKVFHSEIQSGIISYIAITLKFDPFSYNKKLEDFRKKRNAVTHPKGKKPDEKDCLEILNMLKSIIIKKNNHATNS